MAHYIANKHMDPTTGKPVSWNRDLYTELMQGNEVKLEDWADLIYGSKSSEAKAMVGGRICDMRARIEHASKKMLIARAETYYLVDTKDVDTMVEETGRRFSRTRRSEKAWGRGITIGITANQKTFVQIAQQQAQELVALAFTTAPNYQKITGGKNAKTTASGNSKSKRLNTRLKPTP